MTIYTDEVGVTCRRLGRGAGRDTRPGDVGPRGRCESDTSASIGGGYGETGDRLSDEFSGCWH